MNTAQFVGQYRNLAEALGQQIRFGLWHRFKKKEAEHFERRRKLREVQTHQKNGDCHFIFASLALDVSDVDLVKRRTRIWRILEDASNQAQDRTKGFNERWVGINDE